MTTPASSPSEDQRLQNFVEIFVIGAQKHAYPNAHMLISALYSDAQFPFRMRLAGFLDGEEDPEELLTLFSDHRAQISNALHRALSDRIELRDLQLLELQRAATWDDLEVHFNVRDVVRNTLAFYVRLRLKAAVRGGSILLHPGSVWKDQEA